MAQTVRPDSDVSVVGWTPTPAHTVLSDQIFSTYTEFRWAGSQQATIECGLGDPSATPGSRSFHTVRVLLTWGANTGSGGGGTTLGGPGIGSGQATE